MVENMLFGIEVETGDVANNIKENIYLGKKLQLQLACFNSRVIRVKTEI